MKKRRLLAFAAVIALSACMKEDYDENPSAVDDLNAVNLRESGSIQYVGYGFDPLTFTEKRSILKKPSQKGTTANFGPGASKASLIITKIDSEYSIDKLLSTTSGFKLSLRDGSQGVEPPTEGPAVPPVETPPTNPETEEGAPDVFRGTLEDITEILTGDPEKKFRDLFNRNIFSPNAAPDLPVEVGGEGENPPPPAGGDPETPELGDLIPRVEADFASVRETRFDFRVKDALVKTLKRSGRKEVMAARLIVPITKYFIKDNAQDSEESLTFLREFGPEDYLKRYGPAYVTEEIAAFEMIFTFTYQFKSDGKGSRKEKEFDFGIGLAQFFGAEFQNATIETSNREFASAISDINFETNYIGPGIPIYTSGKDFVDNFLGQGPRGVVAVIDRVREAVKANPLLLIPFSQKFAAHRDLANTTSTMDGPLATRSKRAKRLREFNNRIFERAFKSMDRCRTIKNQWQTMQARLETVVALAKGTRGGPSPKAVNALNKARQTVERLDSQQNCRNIKSPPRSFANITE